MNSRKFIIAALASAAIVSGGCAMTMPSQPAEAQAANPAPPASPQRPPQPPRQRASHIEGRIAFLKTELKITPAQEAQWEKVAQAMRQNATERREGFQRVGERREPPNALRHLEAEARFAALRAQQADRFLAAFRPLYDSMADAQKKTADDLLAPHHDRHFRHRA